MSFRTTLDEEIKNHNDYEDKSKFVSSNNILNRKGEKYRSPIMEPIRKRTVPKLELTISTFFSCFAIFQVRVTLG